ncbi:hypothetical protein Q6A51_08710 [Pseudomonas sp. KFB-139]|uniref:Uncharacterized protein n=1 Tax=Pseudomonas serbiensis TaxID=3064350 RepID=A0ABT9CSQ0_9PSED|nr:MULTISPECIES: hypothetical protein [Pseudomonas]MDO7926855.1 hypothetical protein [Pseudomonas sp. KFB-138]
MAWAPGTGYPSGLPLLQLSTQQQLFSIMPSITQPRFGLDCAQRPLAVACSTWHDTCNPVITSQP